MLCFPLHALFSRVLVKAQTDVWSWFNLRDRTAHGRQVTEQSLNLRQTRLRLQAACESNCIQCQSLKELRGTFNVGYFVT